MTIDAVAVLCELSDADVAFIVDAVDTNLLADQRRYCSTMRAPKSGAGKGLHVSEDHMDVREDFEKLAVILRGANQAEPEKWLLIRCSPTIETGRSASFEAAKGTTVKLNALISCHKWWR